MAKKKSGLRTDDLVYALLYILVGVLFCIFRGSILGPLMTVVGVLFIISGIVVLIAEKDTLSALVSIVIGLVILLGGWLFVEIILLVFGILFLVKGISDLAYAFKRKNVLGILAAVLSIAAGVLLIIKKWVAIDWLFFVIGAFFIVSGIMLLLGVGGKSRTRR